MTDTKRERVAALISRLAQRSTSGYSVAAVNHLPGWSLYEDARPKRKSTWYVSTPTQPRDPVIAWAVPPSEHVFEERAALIAFLEERWLPEARYFVELPSAPPAPSPVLPPAPAPTESITRASLDQAAGRWAPARSSGTWHRVGFHVEDATLDLSKAREAPPTGSPACPSCVMGERD